MKENTKAEEKTTTQTKPAASARRLQGTSDTKTNSASLKSLVTVPPCSGTCKVPLFGITRKIKDGPP